ncbi:MAG: RNA polymerase sigma-70 factor [Bacteroidetes bacterium]|nr:RNA polymerase sigma-70 factor [Bacteroidota bacterium]
MNTATVPGDSLQIKSKADFEVLFKTHYSPLCAYANGFLRDKDAAEEVVQEVMFRIWTCRNTLAIESSVRSYLYRAVRNGCLNILKHLNVRDEYKSFRERQGEATQRSQEDIMILSELEQKIREAIDRLPLERRRVFILSRYDGLTYNQIAEKLNISVKTVENQMGKALKTLRTELSDYLPWLILFFYDVFGK